MSDGYHVDPRIQRYVDERNAINVEKLLARLVQALEMLQRMTDWADDALQMYEGNPGPSERDGKNLVVEARVLVAEEMGE